MGIEQRQQERRAFTEAERYLIEYKIAGKFFRSREVALTLNLSASGLLFKSTNIFPVNTSLDVMMNFPHLKKPIHLVARVVRTEPTLREKMYNIALNFTEISDQDRAMIAQFCTEKKEVSPAKPAGEETKPLG